jgi:CubicO group peptidase (beta-lactamase class C family)
MRLFFALVGLFFGFKNGLFSQNAPLYFPPLAGNVWATTPPSALNFCPDRIENLYQFLEDRDSKSFILLHDGKIVLERYFGTYGPDSLFYWASAGKSLTAFLVGQAQDEGLLDIEEPTATYLGNGWTSCTPDQELAIRVRHQLAMTTGLDDGVPNDNCDTPNCLIFKAQPGTRWAYHNAPYRLLHDVIEAASGQTIQQFTQTRLGQKIGMGGFWFNHIQYGRARDMARFGLLMQARGIWNGDTLLQNAAYWEAMNQPSQDLNRSYGYLWWLNGQPSYMVPTLQFMIPGPLVPNAPADMYAALGKNDQKIHIVPSKGWVMIRQGEEASGGGSQVPVAFDNDLWAYLNALECGSTSVAPDPSVEPTVQVRHRWKTQTWDIEANLPVAHVAVYDRGGQLLFEEKKGGVTQFSIENARWSAGVYFAQIGLADGRIRPLRLVKVR